MKAVQLLIESKLPEDIRDYNRSYDGKGINDLMREIADKYPDRYTELSQEIQNIGRNASYLQGETIGLEDLRPVIDKDTILKQMREELDVARQNARDDAEFHKERMAIWTKYSDMIQEQTMSAALKQQNPIGMAVSSGARGKAPQLKAMLSTPGLYADYRGKVIPSFVENSFSEGIRPVDFLAGTFGTRSSVVSTKVSTARGGDLAKQLSQITAREVVTKKDCGTGNGIDMEVDSPDLKGRVLAREVAGMPAGTILDREALGQLRKSHSGKVIARSPLTCESGEGICSHCVGVWGGNKLPSIGEHVGMTAANSIGEPLAQNALSAKHTAGMAQGKKTFTGFDYLNQLVQSPEKFPDRAVVAETSGRVESIEEAEQGGTYITVDGKRHYALPGYEAMVSVGDKVEAGNQLSEGLVDPKDVIRLRGLGSGRRYYATRLSQMLEDGGTPGDARNVEIVARAAVNHLLAEEDTDDFLPDDVVSYNQVLQAHKPPKDTQLLEVGKAPGKFLEQPALHYTLGTRLTGSMAQRLKDAGFDKVRVSDHESVYKPIMSNLRRAAHSGDDWLAKQHTSYLTKNLQESAVRGEDTSLDQNTHFAPRLAVGVGFGKDVGTTGKF